MKHVSNILNYRLMTIDDYEAAYDLWITCGNGLNNKDDSREGSKYTCTANLLRECPALSPEKNSAAKLIVTSHGGLTLNTFIAKLS